ncbi:MFS transporter [Rathayibacter sp. VKM Ac-2801]|uniref:MFS transporter n=1 Tax=Rathayibacter sp. VKM Ac-2801 TaxID=2609255 RepID=UPI00131FB2FD|nr:MFS transporter [Rathayibacter sp. VKM Ac-2801]QHC71739.1 MFS transporter [Rathayibacter sp. VKM Ac-2801]
MSAATSAVAQPGAFAPLRIRIFRWLWIVSTISSIGSWMQTVGAQWFLVENNASPAVIALVQTAAAAPALLLGIPAGVLGEFLNRRHLLVGVQAFQTLAGLALVVLSVAGLLNPVLLLTLTFLIGAASTVWLPAYQALIPELVPRPLIPNAAALSSIGVNVARAIGPALAGLVIAQAGIPFVFAANLLTFALFLLVLIGWRGYTPPAPQREPFVSATRAGLRYVLHAGVVRRMYLQLGLFMIPANALWALLPVFASAHLGLDSSGYGILLAALGIGSVSGAFLIPRLRSRWGTNATVMISTVVYGAGLAGAAFSTALVVTLPILLIVGAAWIGVIATLNGTVQAFLPAWVRSRGLSIYQLVLFGGTALGAALTGALGTVFGTTQTLVGAGIVIILVGGSLLIAPLLSTADKDRRVLSLPLTDVPPVITPSQPDDAASGPDDDDRSTLVMIRYEVPGEARSAFLAVARDLERSRRRTGARSWQLYTERENASVLIEVFGVGSWREHLQQHDSRTTGYDQQIIESARALATGDPVTEHFLAAGRM